MNRDGEDGDGVGDGDEKNGDGVLLKLMSAMV